ncbi:hypothetical protein IJJ08_03855 [bacterium]|nr:hypothetical protein [bacterium]
MIPAGVILPFDGNNTAIPAGWSRDTRFDGRFPSAISGTLGQTGGSSAHSHTGSTHTHQPNSHVHSSDEYTSSANGEQGYSSNDDPKSTVSEGHRHKAQVSNASFSGNALSDKVDYASTTALPPYYEVIFIKADTDSQIPAESLVYRSSARSGLSFHSASQNRFLKGAVAGGNAGGTGGSNTHSHSVTHTHTAVSHTHSGTTGESTDTDRRQADGGSVIGQHTHTFSFSQSLTGDTFTGTSPSETNLPTYTNLGLYKAASQTNVAVGDIAITTSSSNPTGWITCDGTNGTPKLSGFYVRNSQTSGTGGKVKHTHESGNSHTHSQSHNHGGSVTTNTNQGGHGAYGGTLKASQNHSHTITNISTVNMTWQAASMSAGETSWEPPYIRVRYIMATQTALSDGYGPALLLLLDR